MRSVLLVLLHCDPESILVVENKISDSFVQALATSPDSVVVIQADVIVITSASYDDLHDHLLSTK
jgi:hypothetical protein